MRTCLGQVGSVGTLATQQGTAHPRAEFEFLCNETSLWRSISELQNHSSNLTKPPRDYLRLTVQI